MKTEFQESAIRRGRCFMEEWDKSVFPNCIIHAKVRHSCCFWSMGQGQRGDYQGGICRGASAGVMLMTLWLWPVRSRNAQNVSRAQHLVETICFLQSHQYMCHGRVLLSLLNDDLKALGYSTQSLFSVLPNFVEVPNAILLKTSVTIFINKGLQKEWNLKNKVLK